MKSVIVTEKPSVARTFAKVLGVHSDKHDGYLEDDRYIITWCVGHLVTMAYPEKYDEKLKQWSFDTLPFLPETYKYEVIKDVKAQFNIVKKIYNRSDIDTIYYAGDSAREGIYIQMLVRQEAGRNKNAKELVVWIDSQTPDEIRRGIKEAKPITEYKYLIQSGYMRAIEDYALGINLSRALTLRYRNSYSSKKSIAVGRVMTCVLGMIVRREREIKDFKAETYHKINANFNNGADIVCSWKANETSAIYPKIVPQLYNESGFKSEDYAKKFVSGLGDTIKIEHLERKNEKKYAPSFFNLAELQATCSKLYKISPDKTLEVAQTLYEKQLTTYPRTDARVLSEAVLKETIPATLKGLAKEYGQFTDKIDNPFSIKGIKKYVDDSKISDHYAIIPTGSLATNGLTETESKVFDLIVRRFLAPFLPPAIYDKVNLEVVDTKRGEHFFASGSALKDKGYLECAGTKGKADNLPEAILSLKEGDVFNCKYEIVSAETTPPARYTSGSMILAMENAGKLIEDEELRAQIKGQGIGTSATRGATLEKLVANGYIAQNSKTQILTPLEFGEFIYEAVNDTVPQMLDPKMTAEWERGLDLIVQQKISYDKYRNRLEDFIRDAVVTIKNVSMSDSVQETASKITSDKDKAKAPSKAAVSTYLHVPFEDKEKAKALGARWDMKNKAWYAPKNADLKLFAKWIPSKAVTSIKKVWLDVPFENKDMAKKAGARWDKDKKKWYCMSNDDMSVLKKWVINK